MSYINKKIASLLTFVILALSLIGSPTPGSASTYTNVNDHVYANVYTNVYANVYTDAYGQYPLGAPPVTPPDKPPVATPPAKPNYSKLIKSSAVTAKLISDSKLYAQNSYKSKKIGYAKKNTYVEIIQDRAAQWYNIKIGATYGWVPRKTLYIPPDSPTNPVKMTREEIEGYVNQSGFQSTTKYLVWVDINRQQTHVFLGSKNNWKLAKTITVSTGVNVTPTIRGSFTIQSDRGTWTDAGAKYYVRIKGPYMFHSITMTKKGKILDATLGKRASHGCVRMAIADSQWFYHYLPVKTAVWIY